MLNGCLPNDLNRRDGKLKLNKLQNKFFEQIIGVELDVPVPAKLNYQGAAFDVIVVPEITPEGHFRLKYYNAPSYEPEPQIIGDGIANKRYSIREAFGGHPLLEQAWRERAEIELELSPSRMPPHPRSKHILRTRIRYAGIRHRGELVLDNNQVVLNGSSLNFVEFSLSNFTDFEDSRGWLGTGAGITESDRQVLQDINSKLPDEAKLTVRPGPNKVVLNTGDGWEVTIRKDENPGNDAVTHTGTVERNGGDDFTAVELEGILEGLRYFFAFIMGSYCSPNVVVGNDKNRRIVWGEVGEFQFGSQFEVNWFNHSGEAKWGHIIEHLFPLFWARWTAHKDEMNAAIDCYVRSVSMRKAGLPQDAVAKSCFGLEILSSLVLGKTIEHNPDKRIDKVLQCYRIPNRHILGADTPILDRLRTNLNTGNNLGATLVVDVRNYVAHPLDLKIAGIKARYLQFLDSDWIQYVYLHDLSQFYLEYVLLRYCGFKTWEHRRLLETRQ